jgi:RNA polymerase sigma-70 factor, ECF subfamily
MIAANCLQPELARWIEAAVADTMRALADAASAGPLDGSISAMPGDLADIELTRGGDSDAYRRLVERHQGHVGRILWRFSRDRAVHEELVQDTFVEAYMSLHTYREKGPFEHWLARVATRVGYRFWKDKARRQTSQPLSLEQWDRATADDGIVDALEPGDAAALLYGLLEQLPARDRLVLTLRYLDECDVLETARRTGWTQAMVKVQTLRARKKLRKLIEQNRTEWIE